MNIKVLGDYLPTGGFPGGSVHDTGDTGLIPESGGSPGKRNGYPLQFSCLKNSMDRRAWRTTVHGVTKSQTRPNDIHLLTNIIFIYFLRSYLMGKNDLSLRLRTSQAYLLKL